MARARAHYGGSAGRKVDQDLADIAAYYAVQARSGGQTDPDCWRWVKRCIAVGWRSAMSRPVPPAIRPRSGQCSRGLPALAGQHAQYIATQLRMYRKGYEDEAGRTNDGDSKIMRTTAFGLSDKEIEAVASYVAGLK